MSEFNPHILVVIRWVFNPDSVSEKELFSNYKAALVARSDCAAGRAACNAAGAARAAYSYHADAARPDDYFYTATPARLHRLARYAEKQLNKTEEHLNEYFKITKENRKKYEERAWYLLGI